MNQSFFLRTSLPFYCALDILGPQIYVVVEQFGAENILLLSGRLALKGFDFLTPLLVSKLMFLIKKQNVDNNKTAIYSKYSNNFPELRHVNAQRISGVC